MAVLAGTLAFGFAVALFSLYRHGVSRLWQRAVSFLAGSSEDDMNQMANTVLATMTVVLFAQMHDREKAFERAFSYWQAYCGLQ